MTLYRKMLVLFPVVAIVPFLLLALLARGTALSLADAAAEAEALSRARNAGRAVANGDALTRSTLQAFASLADGEISPDRLRRILEAAVASRPGAFAGLSVVDSAGDVLAFVGQEDPGERCLGGVLSRPRSITVPLGLGGGTLEAAYHPGADLPAPAPAPWAVYDQDGTLVAGAPCAGPPALPGQLPSGTTGGILTGPGEGADGGPLAFAVVPGVEWTAISNGESAVRAPLAGFFREYWLYVLALGAATLLAFSFLLRPLGTYVEDLTRAVERVAHGDLRPWFPTPRSDEMGRLSRAFQSMTDRLEGMMEQVDRSSRLAVLGKLSAYLAHEIRNPLSAVQMNLQRLDRWQKKGEIPDHCADAIRLSLKETGRLSSAVSNVLQLAPGRAQPSQVISVHDLVEEARDLLAPDFVRRNVQVRVELDAHRDRVVGDPGQLKGAFLNLMINALDVQPDGGELRITSGLVAGSGPPESGTAGPHPLLELRFTDRGPGVPGELRKKIFDPFFSTKELGSGIGLAVAAQAALDHGGDLMLAETRDIGSGAEFIVRLPLAARSSEAPGPEVAPRVAPWLRDDEVTDEESASS